MKRILLVLILLLIVGCSGSLSGKDAHNSPYWHRLDLYTSFDGFDFGNEVTFDKVNGCDPAPALLNGGSFVMIGKSVF